MARWRYGVSLITLGEEIVAEELDGVFGSVESSGLHGWFNVWQNIFLEVLLCGQAVFRHAWRLLNCQLFDLLDFFLVRPQVLAVQAHQL